MGGKDIVDATPVRNMAQSRRGRGRGGAVGYVDPTEDDAAMGARRTSSPLLLCV